jgi:hypothetical protein
MDPDQPHVYLHRYPHRTEVEAAETAVKSSVRDRDRILQAVIDSGRRGMTDTELQRACNLIPNTERPRRRELVQAGLVEKSGRTRPSLDTGNDSIVWTYIRRLRLVRVGGTHGHQEEVRAIRRQAGEAVR